VRNARTALRRKGKEMKKSKSSPPSPKAQEVELLRKDALELAKIAAEKRGKKDFGGAFATARASRLNSEKADQLAKELERGE
jgi:hypothetical protein